MKLLLVYGRLRERGGLRAAVEALTEELRKDGVETEAFSPLKTENLLCSGCGACRGAGLCVADPRGKELLKAAAGCDALLFISSGSLFGLDIDMKNLLERAASLALRREVNPMAGKRAAVLLLCRSGGRRSADQIAALLQKLGLMLESGGLPVLAPGSPDTAQTLRDLARLLTENGEQEGSV